MAIAVVVAAAAVSSALAAPRSRVGSCPPMRPPEATPAGQQRMIGRIVSLEKTGGRYLLRFRPAWLLSGYPAGAVMLAKTGSREVPNDSITVDSNRQFTFLVTPGAKVVVLGPQGQPCAIPTTVARLAGTLKAHRNHFWVRLSGASSVLDLVEQYQP